MMDSGARVTLPLRKFIYSLISEVLIFIFSFKIIANFTNFKLSYYLFNFLIQSVFSILSFFEVLLNLQFFFRSFICATAELILDRFNDYAFIASFIY